MTMPILRITFFTILLLTGCGNRQVVNPVQVQQIESPLQNTLEGMAKAKAPELERGRLGNPQPNDVALHLPSRFQ